jgi:hypothetical protein
MIDSAVCKSTLVFSPSVGRDDSCLGTSLLQYISLRRQEYYEYRGSIRGETRSSLFKEDIFIFALEIY